MTIKKGDRVLRTDGAFRGTIGTIVERYPASTGTWLVDTGDKHQYWDPNFFTVIRDPAPDSPPKLNDGARVATTLPNDSAERKKYPLFRTLFGQFPAAMVAIAHHSYKGNEKHNPGKELQDNRSLSLDDEDCIMRHLLEGDYEGVAWRAVRLLQRKLEAEGAPVAPLATNLPTN